MPSKEQGLKGKTDLVKTWKSETYIKVRRGRLRATSSKSSVSQLSVTIINMWHNPLKKIKGLFWHTILEVVVHDQLASLLWAGGEVGACDRTLTSRSGHKRGEGERTESHSPLQEHNFSDPKTSYKAPSLKGSTTSYGISHGTKALIHWPLKELQDPHCSRSASVLWDLESPFKDSLKGSGFYFYYGISCQCPERNLKTMSFPCIKSWSNFQLE